MHIILYFAHDAKRSFTVSCTMMNASADTLTQASRRSTFAMCMRATTLITGSNGGVLCVC
jgi:hypothetical protein